MGLGSILSGRTTVTTRIQRHTCTYPLVCLVGFVVIVGFCAPILYIWFMCRRNIYIYIYILQNTCTTHNTANALFVTGWRLPCYKLVLSVYVCVCVCVVCMCVCCVSVYVCVCVCIVCQCMCTVCQCMCVYVYALYDGECVRQCVSVV